VTEDVPGNVPADVPVDVPVDASVTAAVDVPASDIPTTRPPLFNTVTSGRAPRRAPKRASRAPEKVFATELEAGELPSVREIKRRAKCGTPRATEIRNSLAAIMQEAPEAA
jgi:hypothetical protein